MATRLIGTDSANPRLPAVVIAATQGTTSSDLAPGDVAANVLVEANAYTDEVAAEIVAGGVNFADDAQTIAGTADNLTVTPAGLNAALPVVDVRSFGAVGDGVVDDSAAIQAAIDYCVGGTIAAGASNSRIARAALHLPAGRYLTTVAPKVVSVSGFHMFGDSGYATTIAVSGARTYGLELDGLMMCDIHDFRIVGTHGLASTDTVRDAVALNWTTAAARSTSNNRFARIFVHELKFTNGLTFGLDSADRQVDNTWIEACLVNGQWTVGETTWWQRGFCSGNGVHGNVVNHNYHSCASSMARWNVHANAVNVTWQGGDIGHAEVDFRHTGALPLVVNGLRSEVSQRLYESDGGVSYGSTASISNVTFEPTGIAADNRFIKIQYSGTYLLENITVAQPAAPTIYVQSTAANPIYVTAIGLHSRTAIGALFVTTATAPTVITSIGYCQLDAAGLPLPSAVSRGVWVKGFNGVSDVVTVVPSLTLGDNSTVASSALTLNAPNGAFSQIIFNRAGAARWQLYNANSNDLYLQDMVNSVMHMTFGPGTAATGRVEVGVRLRVTNANGIQLADGAGPSWMTGTGSPEGVVAGEQGSLYSNRSGGAGSTLYVKQSGGGAATGWAPVT